MFRDHKGEHVFPMFPVPFSLFLQDCPPCILILGERDSRQKKNSRHKEMLKVSKTQKEEGWQEMTAEMTRMT